MQLLKSAIQLKHDAAGLLKEGGKLYLAELADKKKKGRCSSTGYKLHLKA